MDQCLKETRQSEAEEIATGRIGNHKGSTAQKLKVGPSPQATRGNLCGHRRKGL